MIRPRLAPSARRTAISRWRSAARASSRLAMLAQAMSSTTQRRRLPQRQDRAGALVEHALRQRVDMRAVIAIGVGILRARRAAMTRHLRLRVVERPARREAPDHREKAVVALERCLRDRMPARPQLAPSGNANRGGVTPMHLVGHAVDGDAAADDLLDRRRSGASTVRRSRIDDVVAAEGFIVVHEAAAERRPHAECFEEARRDEIARHTFRVFFSIRFASHHAMPGQTGQGFGCARQSKKLAGETDSFLNSSPGPVSAQHHHAVSGVGERQRTQHEPVDRG